MKRVIPLRIIPLAVCLSLLLSVSAWAQDTGKAFRQGDLLLYFQTGYNKVPDLNDFGLGKERTDIPPLGLGLQFSFLDNLSAGVETMVTYMKRSKDVQVVTDNVDRVVREVYGRYYIMFYGNIFFHYPMTIVDPYFGVGLGYHWVRHENVFEPDSEAFYWTGIAGFRLFFGENIPVGIFVQGMFPYPLIAGGLFFRFRLVEDFSKYY